MTVRELLRNGTESVTPISDTPYLDSLVLLQKAAKISREKLLAMSADTVSVEAEREFIRLVGRRTAGIPVAYLTGFREFYSRSFHVEPGVLIPRPDTEVVVEAVLELIETDPAVRRVHDACTGTGCIAVTIAAEIASGRNADTAERRPLEISASDISPIAERVFRQNCDAIIGRPLPFFKSDFLSGVTGPFDLIVSNPPYLTSGETASFSETGNPEPPLALDGGNDGLAAYRILAPLCVELLEKNGYAVFETDSRRTGEVAAICREAGFTVRRIVKDLGNRDRAVVVQKGTR